MSIFAIADLHLPGPYGETKSMEVFEPRWKDAVSKLEKNWRKLVSDGDSVIIPGDISWALKTEDAMADLAFINSLPGTKYLGKGNHDFWWNTANKLNRLFDENGFDSLKLLYNNSYIIENTAVIGARGWFPDPSNQKTAGDTDWSKISAREEIRLSISLKSLPEELGDDTEKILFIHFPPVWNGFECRGIIDMIKSSGIKKVYYGHIHGFYSSEGDFDFEGISFKMISADRLSFAPFPVKITH